MRRLALFLGSGFLLAACTLLLPSPSPTAGRIDCNIADRDCATAMGLAAELIGQEGMGKVTRIVITPGRARLGFLHAEVHICFADGSYQLVDVIGPADERPVATLRDVPWDDPPCD